MKIIKNSRQINSDSKVGTTFKVETRNVKWNSLDSGWTEFLLKYTKALVYMEKSRGDMSEIEKLAKTDKKYMDKIWLYREGPEPKLERNDLVIFDLSDWDNGADRAVDFLISPLYFIMDRESGINEDNLQDETLLSYIKYLRIAKYEDWVNEISNSACSELEKIYGWAQQVYEGFDGEFIIGFDVEGGSVAIDMKGSYDYAEFKITEAGKTDYGRRYEGLTPYDYDGRDKGLAAFKPVTFYGSTNDNFYNVKNTKWSPGNNMAMGVPIRLD